ncbi:MAG: alpha/beta hydrolase [Kiritimatiellales bacterium]
MNSVQANWLCRIGVIVALIFASGTKNTVFASESLDALTKTPESRKTSNGTNYKLYSNASYSGAEQNQLMDVYLPNNSKSTPCPAVLIIHGGGWTGGDKADPRERAFAEFMIDEGYAAVSVNYTLTTFEGAAWKSKRLKGSWPQNIYDCKSALRWMKKNADELGIDQNRIAVIGGSAGGHLALLTGLSAENETLNSGGSFLDQNNSVRCIIDFYGIPDVRRWGGGSFIDESRQEHPEIWALASPVEHLSKKSPPILIVHGTADATVKIDLSNEFVEILKAKSLPHQYVVIENAPHSFGLQPSQMNLRPVVKQFLTENFE